MISGIALTRHSCRHEVEQEVGRLLAARSRQAEAYGTHFADLWRIAADRVLGGKLIRPQLLIGAFETLSANPNASTRDSAVRIAAAVELLHYSFLLHDDVIDGDLLRRGKPNLIGAMLQERDPHIVVGPAGTPPASAKDLHWAHTGGILMGDLMLSAAHQVFARESLPESMRVRLLDLLDYTITESVAGEHLDVGLADGVIPSDLNTVLGMSRLKTATYTFELPLRAAAILAHAPRRTENAIGRIGRHLGVAFQLQDDLLSTFGDAAEHGKDPFSDLREGKETAIIAYARLTSAWPSIEPHLGRSHITHEEGAEIQALLITCGAERFAKSLIDEQIGACFEITSSRESQISPELAQLVGHLVESLEERRS